jgi:hypothetical protein
MNEATERRASEEARNVCANEGCGRPAERRFCDSCALEWSLFHREERAREESERRTR